MKNINTFSIEELKNEAKERFFSKLKTEIDVNAYISDYSDLNSFDELVDHLQDNSAFQSAGEVIYYSNAIEYLKENDPSLNESLEIANEYGFTLENLNSEVLASLLKTRNIEEEFYDLQDEINEFFDSLEEAESEAEDMEEELDIIELFESL